jgi:hypothetical protein
MGRRLVCAGRKRVAENSAAVPALSHSLSTLPPMVQVLVVFGDKATLIGGCRQSTTVAELKGQARARASLRTGTPGAL